MDPDLGGTLLKILAGSGPLTLLLGYICKVLWAKYQATLAEKEALLLKRVEDLAEERNTYRDLSTGRESGEGEAGGQG